MGDAPSVVPIHTAPRRARNGVNKPRLRVSASVLQGRRRRNMSETPARYCGNCGNELDPEDRFCQNCGSAVHQTASVPTPEADVPVPPPPQQEEAGEQPLEQADAQPREPWTTRQYALGCLGVFFVVFVVGAFVAALAGNGGGNEAQKNKKSGGGKDTSPTPELVVSSPSGSPTVTKDSIEVKGEVTPATSKVTV